MYLVIKNGNILAYSKDYISIEHAETIEKNFTDDDLYKIQIGYSYNVDLDRIEKTEKSEEYEKLKIEEQKQNIIKEIGEKINKKNGMLELNLDIRIILQDIENLKILYNNL